MSKADTKPRNILRVLKEKNPENFSTLQTIFNMKATIKHDDMEGRSKMQQLMKVLSDEHYVTWD
ncbi:hypothetical protein BVC80_1631g16 [Macleaya cordata]|uniref:Uncharacterized protein n=1 Tax=Macleaya cordata TaxID=56857 RepID=A0A200Q6R9_MACCD|nr:hypothetical protein BVC80_1631g16 [Macleaya cordata]